MTVLSGIKASLPFLLTFLVPRAISYYRSITVAIKTRPPPCPLPAKASRALNVLFLSICLFFLMSFPSYSRDYQPNVFELTKSRLHIPTHVLFTRLSLIRPLSSADENLREKITTPVSRMLYLRYGSHTLTTCSFCEPADSMSYALHHVPLNILAPHLAHLLLVGLATSAAIAGPTVKALFRTRLVLCALALAILDLYLTINFPISKPNPQSSYPPRGVYWTALILRPLALCFFDVLSAIVIYCAATNRLPFLFPVSDGMGVTSQKIQLHSLISSSVALQKALTKLRACNVARNAVVRDVDGLKRREDKYWRDVAEMEGLAPISTTAGSVTAEATASIWEEEEVMEALARATKGGNGDQSAELDAEKLRREAGLWVDSVMSGLARNQ